VPSLDRSAIEICEIEYASFRSVSAFADAVKASTPTLDCVLLSAGVAMPAYETTTEEGVPGEWEMAIKVNVLSAALLAVELLPLLRNTPGSILEFVGSCGYCNVSSKQVAPLLQSSTGGAELKVLEFLNGRERWSMEAGYCEPKLLLMFVLQGLVESLGGSQGRLPPSSASGTTPILLACCPNQTKTDLGRNFPMSMRFVMTIWNGILARTAEQGSRVLVSGLALGADANGRMWMNDQFDDLSPWMTAEEWEMLQKRAWREIVDVLTAYKPGLFP
jgi:Enoyl-(Acyl carrier protein) reductase